jgi:hypothetical protein
VKLRLIGNETDQEQVIKANWVYMDKIMDKIRFDERYQYWADLIDLTPDSNHSIPILTVQEIKTFI